MWTVAWYAPVGLFSLKPPYATTAGAKSLLVPTPYAVKMALLDAWIRLEGVAIAPQVYLLLRQAAIAAAPPEHACVTNLFVKQLRPRREDGGTDGAESYFQRTIAFREYVSQDGMLGLAVLASEDGQAIIRRLLPQLDYLGKRGSFLQWCPPLEEVEELDARFVVLSEPGAQFVIWSIPQMVDDCDPTTEFKDVDIFSDRQTKRSPIHLPVPYRKMKASRSYTYYRWSPNSS
jgi:hypothetical protein